MSLKKFLLIPLVFSLVLFVGYSSSIVSSIQVIEEQLDLSFNTAIILIIAIFLQVFGHIVQAIKARYLLKPIKESSIRFQFRALSIGYLFNMLLPLRLGELIRARIIAGGLDLSFGFALSQIIIEKAFDAAILGIFGLIIISALYFSSSSLYFYAISLLTVALVVAISALLLTKQNSQLLRIFYGFSNLFRNSLANSLRFKVWSVIYGLQRTLQFKRLLKYTVMTLIAWFFYALSTLILVQFFFPQFSFGQKLLAMISPYFGLAVPAGPANLGVFSNISNAFTHGLTINTDSLLTYILVAWAVLIIPMALIGIVLLFVKTNETVWRQVPKKSSAASLDNKLDRTEDISQEMASFLDNYFSGNTLSHIVHRLELSNDFRLIKYFKGGSDAITILVRQDGQDLVKKIIPLEFEDRLKAQYEWLESHKNINGIVNVLREERAQNYYSIDLEYDKDDRMFFDFMHENPSKRSMDVLDEVWVNLFKNVYGKPSTLKRHTKQRKNYIKKHIFECLEKAAKVDAELLRAVKPERININGGKYDNLYQIMDKIKKHPKAWSDIATYQESKIVHGDVAIDNILVSRTDGKSLLIDPAPDGNIINGPVFDFGKNMQSLYCGYEFLLRDESPVYLIGRDSINYREHSSAQYNKLFEYVRNELAPKYLSEQEQNALLFHAATLHIRRLKHQVYYNPANVLKFYAVGVKTLNDFLAQYD